MTVKKQASVSRSRRAAAAPAPSTATVGEVKVLLLEDVATDAELELRQIRSTGLKVIARRVDHRAAFEAALADFNPDIVISDFRLPGFDGLAAVRMVRTFSADLPFILVTGVLGDEAAVDLTRSGVTDYVLKDRLVRLGPAVLRALASAEEVRRRKAAEAARDRLAKIVENARDAIVSTTLDGIVTSWNAGAERIHGYTAAEMIGKPIQLLMAADARTQFKRLTERLAAGEEVGSFEAQRVGKDGRRSFVSLSLSPIRDDKGDVIGVSTIAYDISAAYEAEQLLKREKAFSDAVVEGLPGIFYVLDRHARLVRWNEAERMVLNLPADRMPGADAMQAVHPDDRAPLMTKLAEVFERGQAVSEGRIIHPGGEVRVYSLGARRLDVEGAQYLVGHGIDITERKLREAEAASLHQQLLDTVAQLRAREGDIARIDELNEVLQTCNSRDEAFPLIGITGQQLFGGSKGTLAVFVERSRALETVARWGEPSTFPEFDVEDCWALRRGQSHELRAPGAGPVCKHFGTPPPGPYLCVPLSVHGEAMGLLTIEFGAGATISDNTRSLIGTFGEVIKLSLSNLQMREALRHQATHDILTGLYNRQYLSDTLMREAHRTVRNHSHLAVAMLDIDHFKRFNDTYGHDAGDLVLRHVGELLRESVRISDVVCRYGGEEFLVMLPETESVVAMSRIENIRRRIAEQHLTFNGQQLPKLTVSAGIAQLPDNAATAEELITIADRALYAAKNAGRDRSVVYGATVTTATVLSGDAARPQPDGPKTAPADAGGGD